jgi:hypothetical protein
MTTPGAAVTEELRRYFSVGPRTRRYREHQDLHRAMIEALHLAATTPGYYVERTHTALAPGFASALAYQKHVAGYRVSGKLAQRLNALSPWQFAALLGRMVDAGVTNTGEGERFFQDLAR